MVEFVKKATNVLRWRIFNFNSKLLYALYQIPASTYEKSERKYYLMNKKRLIQGRRDFRKGELQHFVETLDTQRNDMYHSKAERRHIIRDFIYCYKTYGVVAEDYFYRGFSKMTEEQRDCVISRWRQFHIKESLNPKNKCYLVDDKVEFMHTFRDFLGRIAEDLRTVSKESFEDMLKKCTAVMIKPINGSGGKGIQKVSCENLSDDDICRLYAQYSGKDFLVEECIEQTGILHELNPSSVNTVRISTLNDGKTVVPFGAFVRVGKAGAVVDNLHSGGISWPVNHHTGVVSETGFDGIGREYQMHPDSSIRVAGLQLPNWEEALEKVCNAAQLVPQLGYVSWDVVISEDRVLLIEANANGGAGKPYKADYNMWQYIKEYMDRTLGEDRPMGYF